MGKIIACVRIMICDHDGWASWLLIRIMMGGLARDSNQDHDGKARSQLMLGPRLISKPRARALQGPLALVAARIRVMMYMLEAE
ncbi:Hypothetical protein MVR_LOCUS263 [uncultured virus]|nr:Hypothetical protein MVR_LOCUS263 [uncultured virus]